MGFAINPSMNHLDIPQACIQEIHQSSAEVVLPDARFRGHPCEAYICISKVDKEMKAYVALLNNALKSTLIYTSDFVATTPPDYPRVLVEAEEFVTSMGFTMQKVNLDFSPAMREVIIKGLRIMRPPSPQKRAPVRMPKIDVPQDLVVKTGMDVPPPAASGAAAEADTMTELLSLRAELTSARSALERVTREKVAADQQNASERGKLQASCEQAMESKRLAEERLAQSVLELRKLQQAEAQPDSGELLRLRAQIEQAAADTAAAQQARETLQAELRGARQGVARLEEEKVLLEKRLASAAAQLSALQKDATAAKQQLEDRLATARTEASEATEKLAAMAGLEQSLQEALQREETLRRQAETVGNDLAMTRKELEEIRLRVATTDEALASATKEVEELRASGSSMEAHGKRLAEAEAELATAREQLMAANARIEQLSLEQGQTGDVRQRLARTEAELAEARAELERREGVAATTVAAGDLPVDERFNRLAEEKAAVETEYVRLATESRETEATLSESLSQARAEIERLSNELEIQGQVAAMEQAALRAELRRLIVEGGAAFYTPPPAAEPLPMVHAVPTPAAGPVPQPVPAAPRREEPSPEEEEETPDAPIAGDATILHEFTTDLGGFYGGGGASTTEFRVDPAIDTITYGDLSDVVAVFYSSNFVQAMPDGKGIQRCKGYIVAIKTGEGYRVYVAWYLTENGRVVVCLPEQQPSDSDECVQILKDAVSYFEIVGFMMEIVDLGTTRNSYRRSLKKIPVLKKAPVA